MTKRTIYRDKLTRQRVSQQDDTAQPQRHTQTFGTKGSQSGFLVHTLPALKMKTPEPPLGGAPRRGEPGGHGGRYIETDPKNKMRFV
jgi:hypothetical protein